MRSLAEGETCVSSLTRTEGETEVVNKNETGWTGRSVSNDLRR